MGKDRWHGDYGAEPASEAYLSAAAEKRERYSKYGVGSG